MLNTILKTKASNYIYYRAVKEYAKAYNKEDKQRIIDRLEKIKTKDKNINMLIHKLKNNAFI